MQLKSYLVQYLRREGLSGVLLEQDRAPIPFHFLWFVVLGLFTLLAGINTKGLQGVLPATIGFVCLSTASFVVLLVYFLLRQIWSGREIIAADAKTVGGFYLFIFPLILAAFIYIYTRSVTSTLFLLVFVTVALLGFLFLQSQQHHLHSVSEVVHSLFGAIRRSLGLLSFLIPMLLVVVLFSIFSSELWSAIGGLDTVRLIVGFVLLIIPAVLMVLTRSEGVVNALLRVEQSPGLLLDEAAKLPFLAPKLRRGLISREEWEHATVELTWRHQEKLFENIVPEVRRRVRDRLVLLLLTTSVVLTVVFFIYFLSLFLVLVQDAYVSEWTGLSNADLGRRLSVMEYLIELPVNATIIPRAKVALLLAVFVAESSIVYGLTDDSFKHEFAGWLSDKASDWLAVSSIYRSLAEPGYQVWEYSYANKRKGQVNVSIVVPPGRSAEQVQESCRHLDRRLNEYRRLCVITAFEQNRSDPRYRRGIPGTRWQFIHNKVKGTEFFENATLVADEIRYDDYLGLNSMKDGNNIPDEWFGNTAAASSLSKSIWQTDLARRLIMHPYVFESKHVVTLEIHLLKRLPNSKAYRKLIEELLPLIRDQFNATPNRSIMIDLCFRDTVDSLCMFTWYQDATYITYRDEYTKKSREELPRKWKLP